MQQMGVQALGHAGHVPQAGISLAELDGRYGVQIETMLAHWLDDELLAARLRKPVLAAVAQNSQRQDLGPGGLEDWIFGEARREARLLVPPDRVPGVIAVMRRSAEPEEAPDASEAEWDDEPGRRRFAVPARWLWFGAFITALLGGIGYASVNMVDQSTPRIAVVPAPVTPAPSQPAPPPAPVAMAPAEPVEMPAPVPTELPILEAEQDSPRLSPPSVPVRLEPLQAAPPPPPLVAVAPVLTPAVEAVPPAPAPVAAADDGPVEPPPADREPAPGPPPTPRIFIHYSAIDGRSADRAERLARLLRAERFPSVALRRVPFQIGAPSVRYFFDENLPVADRLMELSSRVLPPNARFSGRSPSDFTHFSPKPQPGTVEIWLPAG